MSVKKILIILCICSKPLLGYADQTTFSFLEGAKLNFGIAIKQLDFDVSDSDASDFNGTLTEGMYTTFFLSLGSPYRYFSESSNFGLYFEFGLSNFKMDSQEVEGDEVDFGTSARGNYVYITPLIFYNFGDKNQKKHSLKLGIGVGIGYLKSKGDIVFTDESSLATHKFDVSDFGWSVNMLVDYRIDNWLIRIRGGGPFIESSGVEYSIFEFSLEFGYSITL